MQLGMVGLGRMGANLVRRSSSHGHECVVYDVNPAAVSALVDEGSAGADSLESLVAQLDAPRTVWVMLPAALVEQTVTAVILRRPIDRICLGCPPTRTVENRKRSFDPLLKREASFHTRQILPKVSQIPLLKER